MLIRIGPTYLLLMVVSFRLANTVDQKNSQCNIFLKKRITNLTHFLSGQPKPIFRTFKIENNIINVDLQNETDLRVES